MSKYLGDHHNVLVGSVKDSQYFSTDLKNRVITKLEDYMGLFSEADETLHQAIGEASATYLFSQEAIKNILQFNPNAKLIVMLRNPVDLLPSLHSQLIVAGQENILDFEAAWRAEGERSEGKQISKFCKDPNVLAYSQWGKLGEQVERLYSTGPAENIKVILFDDFIRDTGAIYEEVLDFLGVPKDGKTSFPVLNEKKHTKNPFMQRALAFTATAWGVLQAISPVKFKLGVYTLLFKLNTSKAKKPVLSNELRNELIEFYRDDIGVLSKRIDKDLSEWVSKSK